MKSPQLLATLFFALAFIHALSVTWIHRAAKHYVQSSKVRNIFFILSEVEIVFPFWALIFLITWSLFENPLEVFRNQKDIRLIEPLFIFCIMILAATKPIISLATNFIILTSHGVSKIFKVNILNAQIGCLLSLGSLLGSFITEPAAITVVALLIYQMIDALEANNKFLYGILAVLFVNISIGGALTNFAAPPILMVAHTWNWDGLQVFRHLGLASTAAIFINTVGFCFLFKRQIVNQLQILKVDSFKFPLWVTLINCGFLLGLIINSHSAIWVAVLYVLFLIFARFTTQYQSKINYRQPLLVSCFLISLIIFGSFQTWWLGPLLKSVSEKSLFFTSILLTAVTDNAALAFLGSQVPNLVDSAKWALVSGSLAGGGLTILANAPNPAGYAILNSKFKDSTLNSFQLFVAALLPTLVATLCFLLLGNF